MEVVYICVHHDKRNICQNVKFSFIDYTEMQIKDEFTADFRGIEQFDAKDFIKLAGPRLEDVGFEAKPYSSHLECL